MPGTLVGTGANKSYTITCPFTADLQTFVEKFNLNDLKFTNNFKGLVKYC